jgi:hypothetical protein
VATAIIGMLMVVDREISLELATFRASTVLTVSLLALLVLLVSTPARRHQNAIDQIEQLGGRVVTTHGGPGWIRQVARGRSVPGFEQATVVNLSRTPVQDEDLRFLHRLNRVERLNLSDTPIADAGLVHVGKLPHLKALDLSRTGIAGEGLRHLSGLSHLEYLYLNGTGVSDDDLRHLHGLTNLILLTVEETNVSEAGVQEIERQLPDVIVEW